MAIETPVVSPTPSRLDASYEELRRLIVEGDLAPGSRILETEIAARLEVSRRTAQSALKRLEREGLIHRPGGSRAPWMVITLSILGFREIADVMVAILCLAARRAAGIGSNERQRLATELRSINDEYRDVATDRSKNFTHLEQMDWRFHGHLVHVVAGMRMRKIYEAQQPTMELYGRNYVTHLADSLATSTDEHGAIVDAIERGDADAADLATRINWANACERYAETIKNEGERGTW